MHFSHRWLVLPFALFCCKTKPEGPFEVREGASGLLFTWIDERGNYHVEQAALDVPAPNRQLVRVVDPKREDGSHDDKVYLADLRVSSPAGLYPVQAAPLKEFEALATSRRAKPATGSPEPTALPSGPAPARLSESVSASAPLVIIYGASWCGPCHDAERFLKLRGIPYVMKDVERDANAAADMQAKLRAAGRGNGSIPVLDVGGKILVGYSATSLADALGKTM
jgi:glutaredoxin